MGSFFVVQVHTGSEIEVKEMLKATLDRTGNKQVKHIYAMEKTTLVGKQLNDNEVDSFNDDDITNHLQIKRIQAGLTTLRNAVEQLKRFQDSDSIDLLLSYRDSIRALTAQLKEMTQKTKKISSVLSGYILIELESDDLTFPAELTSLLRSVPKNMGLVSRNNIPEDEVEHFFQQLDVTPEIEIEFNTLINLNDEIRVEETKRKLLQEANETNSKEKEREVLEKFDALNLSINNEVQELTKHTELTLDKPLQDAPKLLKSINVFLRNTKEIVTMPLSLYKRLHDDSFSHKNNGSSERISFIERLKAVVFNDSKGSDMYEHGERTRKR